MTNRTRKLVIIIGRILPKSMRSSGLRYAYKHHIIAHILGFHNFGAGNLDQELDSFINPSLRKSGFFCRIRGKRRDNLLEFKTA